MRIDHTTAARGVQYTGIRLKGAEVCADDPLGCRRGLRRLRHERGSHLAGDHRGLPVYEARNEHAGADYNCSGRISVSLAPVLRRYVNVQAHAT